MAKTIEEIKELLATELFRKRIVKKYIVVNDDLRLLTNILYYCYAK
ncbi:hypothetical protein EZS27_014262 [termite gut metagenome]|uniref:Uncharacterized protein n=1 Tax=termite gut metagenome TaxID=433724 RepID=A0A5J4RUG6_9ZZZZ